jgi:glutamine cyclotransferase
VNRFLFAAILALPGCAPQPQTQPPAPVAAPISITQNAAAPEVATLGWRVVRSFPHDPQAFTQGLLWHEGHLLESTGLEGRSSLRRVELESGKVLQRRDLPSPIFAEGLARIGNRLYQLSWQNRVGFVYDAKTFAPIAKFSYRNEGWGLTSDNRNLIQSDGSDTLVWRDPTTFRSLKTLRVTRNGAPLRSLNELEWIDGNIWANVWQTDEIVVIDPRTGVVKSQLNLQGLLNTAQRTGNEDVLNGIAYDAQNKRIFITGKNWPKLFWIEVEGIAKS